ncbi:MAG: dihydroorotate dehydrogenase [Candidatus Omnitrophica bacterium]|nr:dihydroorotate dehydrogenase [Candidatus Omnitrophota bacterium]
MDLSTSLGRLKLKNPVLVASGTFGIGEEMRRIFNIDLLGGIITKSVTLKARFGNPPPRICETPSGMLNSIGLENVGLERFLKEKLPFLKKRKTVTIVNVAGHTLDEFVTVARALDRAGVRALELNLSCPNVGREGLEWSQDPRRAAEVVRAVKRRVRACVIAKLSPNVTDITEIARAAKDGGADAVSLINSLIGMAIDPVTRAPRLGAQTGGLTGPAIRPVAVRCVWEVARSVRIPILGMGGIASAEDALEFILAGASAVAIGSANFVNPKAALEVIQGLGNYLKRCQIRGISDLVGGAQPHA